MAIVEQEREVERLVEPDLVLLEALKLVKRGWCQGTDVNVVENDDYGIELYYCPLGAIAEVAEDNDEEFVSARERLRRSLGLPTYNDDPSFPDIHPIAIWNDNLDRTKEQVVEAMERAAYFER